MEMSQSIASIAKALSQFQSEVKQPKKDKTNPHFKADYVTLDSVIDTINKIAPKFGLSYTQIPISEEGKSGVMTILMHESGEFLKFDPYKLPMDKQTSQGSGSALTYARRYSLSAAFGISSDTDDDAEGSMDRTSKNNQSEQPRNQQKSNIHKPLNAQEAAAIILPFGKHKGKTLKELFMNEKGYIKWLSEQNSTDENIKEAIDLMQQAIALQTAQQKMNQ